MANRALLTDLALHLVDSRALSIYRVKATRKRDVSARRSATVRDIALTSDVDNLAQAVALRLLTPRGELSALGHPEYGSRLAELIGEVRTETTRNLAKLFVIEALKQERRIAEIVEVVVEDHPGDRHRMNISIRVRAIDDSAIVDLGPFSVDLS